MAMGRWWIRGVHGDFVIVQRGWGGKAELPGGVEVLTSHAASERIDALLADGWGQGLDPAMLAEIAQAVGEPPMPSDDGDARRRLKGVLVQAFRSGALTIARARLISANLVGGEAPEEPHVEHVERKEETAWLEIVLTTDEDPPAPIAFKRYRVELPDGGIREGQLDSRGMARLSGIDPGTCQVSFPDFDASQWRRA